MENINIYFVNYKNSVAGVGGVGTVSRDLVKLHPEIRFAFWDGSEATRNNDLGLIIQGLDHNKIHKQYFKKYLWAALHGIDFSVNDQELSIVRRQLIDEAGQVAVQLTDEANKINRQVNNVFWLNDYTSIAVIGKLRKLNKNSTLIFSFRTPFGVNGSYPKLHSGDMPIFKA